MAVARGSFAESRAHLSLPRDAAGINPAVFAAWAQFGAKTRRQAPSSRSSWPRQPVNDTETITP